MEHAVVKHPTKRLPARPVNNTGGVRGVAWTDGGLVSHATGRVFFTLDGVEYACSAAVVAGVRADVVMTAAHCVSDGSGGWAQNWTFIPGYTAGRAPYGRYVAKTFYVAGRWADGSDEDDDVAFVVVKPAPGSPATGSPAKDVADLTGSEPIVFGYRSPTTTVFGYPAEAPYNGAKLDYCAGKVLADPYGAADAGVRCAMTEGDSGGPWLSDFDPATGSGFITGVTSFKYAGAQRVVYSADLGAVAQALYTRAERVLPGNNSSIWRARAKSAAVRPPAEWVDRVSVTAFHAIAMSGWWPARSAR
jgi:V8-like Glu-specific endopeptidase